MPLTPQSRIYEQKLERSRKKYESRNAFATERSKKAKEEAFSTAPPKTARLNANLRGANFMRGGLAVEGVKTLLDWDTLKSAYDNPTDTLQGLGKTGLIAYNPALAGAVLGPEGALKAAFALDPDVQKSSAITSLLPMGKGVQLTAKATEKLAPKVFNTLTRAGEKLGPEGFNATSMGIKSIPQPRSAARKATNSSDKAEAQTLFPSNSKWTFDPSRIAESAQAATEASKEIAKAGARGRKPQREIDAAILSKMGISDLRDIIYLQNYGSLGGLVAPDAQYTDRLSRLVPESLTANFLSPAGNVSTTRKTLFAADRFKETKWLDNGSSETQPQLEGIASSPQLQIVRDTLERAIREGRLRATPGVSDDVMQDYDYFNRLAQNMNPDYVLPRGIKDDLGRGFGRQGEHSALPVSNATFSVKALTDLGKTKNIDELPALLEAIKLYGLDLGKGANQGFASLPRVVDGEISENAPAFKQLVELGYPIMFDRFKQAGGLDFYRQDLAKQLLAAPNLGPEILDVLSMPEILSALRGRQVARGKPQIV